MIRSCAVCKIILGEKCARCGAPAEPLTVNAREHAISGTQFLCQGCGYIFTEGDGGETLGLCDLCLRLERRKAAAG
jgi:transposase-like protein